MRWCLSSQRTLLEGKHVYQQYRPSKGADTDDACERYAGQIVSRTLAQNKAVSITLFAFDKGTEISTHESTGDAMVQVLEGTGCFTVDGKEYLVHPGEVLVMPANVPHAVSAPEAFKWVLTVVFPEGFKK